jgi:hypothetical protein
MTVIIRRVVRKINSTHLMAFMRDFDEFMMMETYWKIESAFSPSIQFLAVALAFRSIPFSNRGSHKGISRDAIQLMQFTANGRGIFTIVLVWHTLILNIAFGGN